MGQHIHRLQAIDEGKRKAYCAECGRDTPVRPVGNGKWRCATAYQLLAANRRSSGTNSFKEYVTRMREEFLAAQGGVCALCKRSAEKWCLDHDHENGMVRGVLCYPCNNGIGQFGDSPEALMMAVDYLDLWRAKHAAEAYPPYKKTRRIAV